MTIKTAAIVLALLWPVSALAVIYGNVRVSGVVSVYDADTFRVNIEGWPDLIGKNIPVRVNGVDAPDIRGECPSEKQAAQEAKGFTLKKLTEAQGIELRNIKRGKYFRIIADVYVDGENLSDLLIRAGYARPYDGGKREGWCSP